MNNNELVFGVVCCITIVICILIGAISIYYYDTKMKYIESGYTQKVIPIVYDKVWVKE